MKILLGFALLYLFLSLPLQAQDREATREYIHTYAPLAVAQMQKSGMPASVILAQAIHESQSGRSPLAKLANNHFGIKCKDYWEGDRYFHKDDDLNASGQLIQSCFREYASDRRSYEDHTHFLQHSPHYAPLWKHPISDYKSWAQSLKECGYATDPHYAKKIISIIERFDLTVFDQVMDGGEDVFGTVLASSESVDRIVLPENYQRRRDMDK